MLRIAICDDDKYVCKDIENLIIEYDIKFELDVTVDTYTSCNELFNKLQNDVDYDLIFLDIEFPDMSGIELGDKIRNILKNTKMQIVFISAKQGYAMELFNIQPFNFLIKPLDKEKVISCISKFVNYYNKICSFFTYTYENLKYQVAVNEIIYFQSNGKKIIMHKEDEDIEFYGKFSGVMENELKNQFVIIKRGFAINIHHIKQSSFKTLLLSDGTKLEISRNCRESVRDRLSIY